MRLTTFWEVLMRLKRLLFCIASMLNGGSAKSSVYLEELFIAFIVR